MAELELQLEDLKVLTATITNPDLKCMVDELVERAEAYKGTLECERQTQQIRNVLHNLGIL